MGVRIRRLATENAKYEKRSEYLSQRRQGAKVRERCHFDQREKSLLYLLPRLELTGPVVHLVPLREILYSHLTEVDLDA